MGIETAALVGYAAAASAVVGTAVSVYSANEQSKNAKNLANQQEQMAADDAAYAASEAQLQARAIRKAADKQRAEARAALSSSGVVVGEGTAEQIDATIGSNAEEDALMSIYDGKNRSRNISVAGSQEAQRSRNAASAASTSAWTSALQGGATIARGWNTSAAGKRG